MLQPVKRFIRLKERKKQVFIHSASDKYLNARPTLEKKYYYEFTNSKHFLMNEFNIISDSSVVVIGDSFAESLFCESHKRISSLLLSNFALNGYNLNILNAGVSGMTSLNALNLIINKISTLRPKHIILFIPTNDGICMSLENGLWNESKAYSNLLGLDHISKVSRENIENKISDLCNIYTLIINTCKLFKISLTVCSSPTIEKNLDNFFLKDQISHSSLSYYRNLVFDNILKHCQSLDVETIDLRTEFSNKQKLFFDDVHTNEMGSTMIANYVFEKIKHHFNNLKSVDFKFTKNNIFKKINLKQEITYSDRIKLNLNKKHHITVSFHIDCLEDFNENNALFNVKFDDHQNLEYSDTGLKVSEAFGNFSYIQTKSHAKYRISYSFQVPTGISNIKIGFKTWKTSKTILVEDVNLFIQDI